MLKRLPLIPTLVVLAAVAVMVRLGFWQIDRMHEKNTLLARFSASAQLLPVTDLAGKKGESYDLLLFRKIGVECSKVGGISQRAGRNLQGETGWAHEAQCLENGAPRIDGQTRYCIDDCGKTTLRVVLGWSRKPDPVSWNGGKVHGTVVSAKEGEFRIVADSPLAGLEPNARPDPTDLPNNHWSYAIQWFLFAGIALVIYGLALRKRLAAKDTAG